MANVVIRLASEADLPDVIEMSKGVYGGNDYFPGEFLNVLNDPNRRVLIAAKEGKAVGLQVVHIIDEGKTAIAQALRVHLNYRRQGIGEKLIRECRNYVKEHFPQVTFERYSVNSQSVERLGIQKKLNDSLFHTVVFFAFFVDGNVFELSSQLTCDITDDPSNFVVLNKMSLEDALDQGKLDNILFNDKFIVHWQPFKALGSNIPKGLFKDGDSVLASYSGEMVESLSHSRWCAIEKCPHLFTVAYTLNEKLLRAHLVKQLQNAVSQHPGERFLFLPIVDPSLIECTSQLLLNDLALKILDDEFGGKKYYHLYFFEHALHGNEAV